MFNVYGHLPQQRDDNTTLRHMDQKNATEFLIYSTESEAEAKEIVLAGGFIKEGQWHVATRYESVPPTGLAPRDSAAGRSGNAEPRLRKSEGTPLKLGNTIVPPYSPPKKSDF